MDQSPINCAGCGQLNTDPSCKTMVVLNPDNDAAICNECIALAAEVVGIKMPISASDRALRLHCVELAMGVPGDPAENALRIYDFIRAGPPSVPIEGP